MIPDGGLWRNNRRRRTETDRRRSEETGSSADPPGSADHPRKDSAANIRAGSLVDTAAQVRLAVYGVEPPDSRAGKSEWIRYIIIIMGRIPAISKDAAWERRRTFEDILDRASSQGSNEMVLNDLKSFAAQLSLDISTADPRAATGGLTGIGALITSDRRETLSQRVVQSTIGQNQPGLIDAFKSVFVGRKPQP